MLVSCLKCQVCFKGRKESQKENTEKVRGVDSCFLFFFSRGEFGLANLGKRMTLRAPQVVGVIPWVIRLVSVGCRGWGGVLTLSFP